MTAKEMLKAIPVRYEVMNFETYLEEVIHGFDFKTGFDLEYVFLPFLANRTFSIEQGQAILEQCVAMERGFV